MLPFATEVAVITYNVGLSNCRKAYYSLQRAGMWPNGLCIEISSHLFSVTRKNILLYRCNALQISRQNIIELDELQAKLINHNISVTFGL